MSDPLGLTADQRALSDMSRHLTPWMSNALGALDMAMRWAVKVSPDATNRCDPCDKNKNKTYRNRASAYADYPGGKGYIKCVGAQYGNSCRCTVVKRRKS